MKNVTIYSTPTCGFCTMAKDFFKENNVEFTEHDVSQDQEQQKLMVEKSGQMGVPVIILGDDQGEEVIVGFDKDKLVESLGLSA